MIANVYIGNIATAGGTANAITASYVPAPTVLADKMILYFRATAANTTTTPTFSPNNLTAHTIVKKGGQALAAGDIPGAGAIMEVVYDEANTRWELLNPAASAALGYKSYVATVIQEAGNDPVATVLENTLGGTVVWTRDTVGQYFATLNGAFPNTIKTHLSIGTTTGIGFCNIYHNDANSILVNTFEQNPANQLFELTDGLLFHTSVAIEVYP